MPWRIIEPHEWTEFLTGFSREHDGWRVCLMGSRRGRLLGGPRFRPLQGLQFERTGVTHHILISVANGETETVRIERPTRLSLDETVDHAHRSLLIESDEEDYLLSFRVAIASDRVDG